MNCPRCGAAGFVQTCRDCGLLTPRAIEEVKKALAAVEARGNPDPIMDLLRRELEQQGALSSDDIATVIGLGQSRSRDASNPPAAIRPAPRPSDAPRPRSSGVCQACGGRNFAWATKCDHCGQPLSKPSPPEQRAAVRSTAPTISWAPDDFSRAARDIPWQVGDVLFGWYRVDVIRAGAFGFVYLCHHIATDEGQAIKTVQRDPLADDRVRRDMRREAESWALLDHHPNVVSCDFVLPGSVDKRLWLGLERIDGDPVRGTTLREWIAPGPLVVDDVVRIALGICDGMTHVAAAGLVHRDLKPENVLMTRDGFAKVTDLGLAEPLVRDADGTAAPLAGTPRYMSPESWLAGSPPSTAGDVYAFGVSLWELLTGSHPFADNSSVPLQRAHREMTPADPRTLNPNAPASLSRIALECLAKRPDDRPGFGTVVGRIREQWPAIASHGDDVRSSTGVGTMCNRVAALITLGHVAEAENLLERARRAAPDHPFVHAQRMKLCSVTGKLGEARESLEAVARVQ